MSNRNSGFEKSIVESYQDFEVPYQEGSWEQLQKQMNGGSTGSNSAGVVGLFAILAAACAGIILGWYFFGNATGIEATTAQLSTTVTERSHFEILQERSTDLRSNEFLADLSETSATVMDAQANETAAAETQEQSTAVGSMEAVESRHSEEITADVSSLTAPDHTFPGEVDLTDSQDLNEDEDEVIETEDGSHLVEIPAVDGMPAIPISISTREACEGTAVQFQIETEIVDGNYLWNFGDGSFSNQPNPVHTYQKAGTYDITLSVTSNKDGVIRTKTMDQLILVNPNPEAAFVWEFDGMDDGAPIVRLNNQSRRANHATWAIIDEINEDINPVTRIESKGVHEIQLVASNEFGCENKVVRTISINEDYALMAPTRFSPNGDGVFDTFMPRALMSGDYRFTMRVYDGEQVIYETSDASKPWDGMLPDGTVAEPGMDFVWEAIIHRAKGDKYYSGEISVVR